MPPSALPAPPMRILDSDAAEERARNRQAWGELWQAIAREADADCLNEPRDEATPADSFA